MRHVPNIINIKKLEHGMNVPHSVYDLIVEILEVYNCRASEVLNAKWSNYHEGKFLILHGTKGSNNIVIRDRRILDSIEHLRRNDPELIFVQVSYNQIYNYIKKYYSHLFTPVGRRKNKAITHYFRYENVKSIAVTEEATSILHHRSKKSAKYYNSKLAT